MCGVEGHYSTHTQTRLQQQSPGENSCTSVCSTAAVLKPRGKKGRRVPLLRDRRAASYLGQKEHRRRDVNGCELCLHRGRHTAP